MMAGFGMGFGALGMVFMFLFWGVLILLAVWLVKSLFSSNPQSQPPSLSRRENPKDILDLRYARGEITKEEYELIRKDLK